MIDQAYQDRWSMELFVATWSEIVWQDSATRKSMHSSAPGWFSAEEAPQPGQRLYFRRRNPSLKGSKKDGQRVSRSSWAGMSLDELPLLWTLT